MFSPISAAESSSPKLLSQMDGGPLEPVAPGLSSIWLQEPPLLTSDLACYSLALLAIIFLPPLSAHNYTFTEILKLRISLPNLLLAGVCLAAWTLVVRLTSTIDQPTLSKYDALLGLIIQTTLSTIVVEFLLAMHNPRLVGHGEVPSFYFISLSLLLGSRLAVGMFRSSVQPATRRERTVLIVGAGRRGKALAARLGHHPKWNYRLLGFVDPDPVRFGADACNTIVNLEGILSSNHAVEEVIVALPIKSMYDDIQQCIAVCERVGIPCRYSTDLFHTSITKRRSVDRHDGSSVLLHVVHDAGIVFKRAIDVLVSSLALLLLFPLFIAIAIAIKATSKGEVLFRQQRHGLNRRLFTMYKFRRMVTNAEELQANLEHLNETGGPAFKIKKDPRITTIGNFLRRSSLDELPQLWNVFIGDMSLVGPRPLTMRDVSRFSDAWLIRRFSVLPGITGLWQVSGRSSTSFSDWIKLDLDYIDHWSLLLDLKIIAKTFSVVLRGDGAV